MTLGSTPLSELVNLSVHPVALQVAAMETELPIPAWAFGLIAFLALLSMMAIVLSIGKGRPHS